MNLGADDADGAVARCLTDLAEVLRRILAELDDGPATGAQPAFGESRMVRDVRAVVSWHLECMSEYREALGLAPEAGARAVSPGGSGERVASRSFHATNLALGAATNTYRLLERLAEARGDRGTALVAARGLVELAPLTERLSDLIPVLVADEYLSGAREGDEGERKRRPGEE